MDTQDLNADLLTATEKGDSASVIALLAKGAEVTAHDIRGRTALVLAILADDVEMVEALLAKGAAVEVKFDLGMTPLMMAVSAAGKTVPALLAKGADVNAKDNNDKTVLMWAVDPDPWCRAASAIGSSRPTMRSSSRASRR